MPRCFIFIVTFLVWMVMIFPKSCDFFEELHLYEEALRIVVTLLVIVPLDELFFFYIIPIRKIDFEQNPYAGENLEKEPWIMELRNQCRIIRTTELVVAQEKMHKLKRRKEELLRLYSLVSLLHQLQDAMKKMEEESEALLGQLLDREIDHADVTSSL
ncbi:Vacuolar protein-sorting-associated protein 37 -like protein 1 [Capsicum annuum]|nr:Vacuolar protein-sorting-associated protein 37 -like protein 1 [Capsicum annuum]